jgi:hypothetical protein
VSGRSHSRGPDDRQNAGCHLLGVRTRGERFRLNLYYISKPASRMGVTRLTAIALAIEWRRASFSAGSATNGLSSLGCCDV